MSNPVTNSNVALTAEEGLGIVNTLLPFLEAVAPGIAGGPVGIGISAAVALTPILIRLISRLSASGGIDAATQAALMERVAGVFEDFNTPTWTQPVIPPQLALTPPLSGHTSAPT